MGKRIVLAVFGGVACVGLVLMLVGFMLGGRFGSVTVVDGQMVYASGEETVAFAKAPAWANNIHIINWNVSNWHNIWSRTGKPEKPEKPAAGGATTEAPFSASELKKVEIDIAAGYVFIESGDTPSLVVDGTLDYTSTFREGTWTIKADHENITSREGGIFWLNGKDVTTTFTITLPKEFKELDVEIGMGEASVANFTLNEADFDAAMGTMYVENVTAKEAEFTVGMGNMTATGIYADEIGLDCSMGTMDFSGEAAKKLEAECGMGRIYAQVPQPDDYSYTADVGAGSIRLGEHHTAGLGGEMKSGGEAKPRFDLQCGMGSIEVDFN